MKNSDRKSDFSSKNTKRNNFIIFNAFIYAKKFAKIIANNSTSYRYKEFIEKNCEMLGDETFFLKKRKFDKSNYLFLDKKLQNYNTMNSLFITKFQYQNKISQISRKIKISLFNHLHY